MIKPYLLLATPSICLRKLVLRDLFEVSADDPEVLELQELQSTDSLVSSLFALQQVDGSWSRLSEVSRDFGDPVHLTSYALARLGYLGFDQSSEPIRRGVEFLFDRQQRDGSWPLTMKGVREEGDIVLDSISLQTSIPLRGIAAVGSATDSRAEKAYQWLIQQRLPDGSWPTGMAEGNLRGVAGYRRLPHSRWGCRSNTTGALLCLALHPTLRHSEIAHQALDHLLARETHETATLGFEVARVLGYEQVRGLLTHYGRFDLALILSLCSQIGASREDQKVTQLVDFITQEQGELRLWHYQPNPQVDRWLTFEILRSLKRLDVDDAWVSLEPRTPFQAYGKKQRRY